MAEVILYAWQDGDDHVLVDIVEPTKLSDDSVIPSSSSEQRICIKGFQRLIGAPQGVDWHYHPNDEVIRIRYEVKAIESLQMKPQWCNDPVADWLDAPRDSV